MGPNSNSSTLLSIRLKTDTARKLMEIADYEKRAKSFLGAEAIEEYVAAYESQIRAIKEGVKSAEEKKLVSNDEVGIWLYSIGSSNQKMKPAIKSKKRL